MITPRAFLDVFGGAGLPVCETITQGVYSLMLDGVMLRSTTEGAIKKELSERFFKITRKANKRKDQGGKTLKILAKEPGYEAGESGQEPFGHIPRRLDGNAG